MCIRDRVKKRLAGNQVIIAYLRKVSAFDSYTPKPSFTAKQSGKQFKATGGSVKLTKNNKSIEFEMCIRDRDKKEENFAEEVAKQING